MKKRILALVASVVLVMSLVACGTVTLESYYGNALAKKLLDAQMEQQLEEAGDTYTDIAYEVVGNTLTYKFYLAEEMEGGDEMKAMLEESLTSALDQTAPQIKAESKVAEEITLGYIFYNPDGSEYINISKAY
ncbi:MAG: hypothetical protein E7288_08250 [Lachnospiraceae bacterium]|nr:hypothetical protein [Lachnospiraceae bacterium]